MSRWLRLAVALCGLSLVNGVGSNEANLAPYELSRCSKTCPQCREPDCEETVIDQCGCCPVCVRHVGESCGAEAGVCATHLTCTQLNDNDELGQCTEMYPERCLKAMCSVVFHPECPPDSRLVILPPPQGQCCGRPGTCHCDQQKCEAFVPICEAGTERTLIEEGGHEPGKCCDRFECKKRELHCLSVHCPPHVLEEDGGVNECPADSIRPAIHIPQRTCCPIKPGCRCRAAVCRPAVCPEGKKLKIIRKGNGNPGKCCDEWECEDDPQSLSKSCIRDGKTYADGEDWHSSSCEMCKCKKGVAVCSKMSCPKTPGRCTWIVIPDGECCPICVGCQTERLEKKKKHEIWQKDDCTTCTCSEEGTHVCEKHMCRTECENSRKVNGQCCPVCDEPVVLTLPATCPSLEHCPLRCENGLRRDDRGCFECECLPVEHPSGSDCPQISKQNCDKQCAHGYVKDGNGCVVCKCAKCPPLHQCFKHCLYGFESNSVGCPVCKCRAISRIDAKLTITEKKLIGWDKCISLSATGKLLERDGGEWWNDGCRHCFCEERQEFCSLISCPTRPKDCNENDWQQKEGSCCPTCITSVVDTTLPTSKHEHTVCQSPGTGRLFTDGETWQLAPCVSCTCRVGHVLCRTVECPPIACKDPVMAPDNQCCPKCLSNTVHNDKFNSETTSICTDEAGIAHVLGSPWRTDDCTSCTCTNVGKIECYRESCEPSEGCVGSPLIIKGRCCPVCSDVLSSADVCSYKSSVYSVNEEWMDGYCTNCSCVTGGHTVCREMVCPQCADPVPIEGHCCPLCKDIGWTAFSESNGSVLVPPRGGWAPLPIIGFLLMSFAIFGLLVVLFILYKRSRNNSKKSFDKSSSSVRLSASKQIGSMPQLVDWPGRRDSHSDGQSESLLSTASDTSTAISSVSSGNSPHNDTQPLTGKRNLPHNKLFQCNV